MATGGGTGQAVQGSQIGRTCCDMLSAVTGQVCMPSRPMVLKIPALQTDLPGQFKVGCVGR